jgi:hypothetical protein
MDAIELGKMAILVDVRQMMAMHGVDLADIVFRWYREFIGSYWELRVHDGVKSRRLRFLEDEIRQWRPELAERFTPRILTLIDRIRGKRW